MAALPLYLTLPRGAAGVSPAERGRLPMSPAGDDGFKEWKIDNQNATILRAKSWRTGDSKRKGISRFADSDCGLLAKIQNREMAIMTEEEFWALIQRSLDGAAGDRGVQYEIMAGELRRLSAEQLEAFGRIHEEQRQRAYTWELWGAVYIIGKGCSDDEFWSFLDWLITKGREWFERAAANPDDLADYPGTLPDPAWEREGFLPMVSEIYLEKFGFIPEVGDYEGFGFPSGERWEQDEETLRSRWPQVFQKYG